MARIRLASGLSLAFALALPLSASAQGIGQPQPTDPTAQPTDPVTAPTPPPQPVESVAPVEASAEATAPPPPAPVTEEVASDDTANRPVGMSFALGAGYSFPVAGGGSLLQPNVASARFRMPSGLTFEPAVELSTSKTTQEVGPIETETEVNEIRAATLVRLPMAARGKVDFQLVGAAGFGFQKTNPDGGNNDTNVTTLSASWGLALEYWPKPRWGLSATGLNPLIALSKTKQEGTPDQTTTNLFIGAIWDPSIFAMLHMYF